MIDWGMKYAAIFRSTKGMLKPIEDIDFVDIDSLYGLEKQKEILLQNTLNFIEGKGANPRLHQHPDNGPHAYATVSQS